MSPDPSDLDVSFPAGVRHAYVDAGGVRFHVAEAGAKDGQPILLVHGWPQHWWCWRKVSPLLGKYRCVMPDLRGHGWTDAPPGAYDKEQFATDLLALLDALDLDRVRLVGHDWGGWVSQLVALRAPERVERLVLCNIAPVWAAEDRLQAAKDAWRLAYQPFVGAPVLGALLQRSPLMRRALPGVPGADRPEFLAALREPGYAEAASAYYRTFLLSELPELARGRYEGQRIASPVLVLHGTGDPVIRPATVGGFRLHADELEIAWLPGAGHFVVDERPVEVAERIVAFLDAGARASTS